MVDRKQARSSAGISRQPGESPEKAVLTTERVVQNLFRRIWLDNCQYNTELFPESKLNFHGCRPCISVRRWPARDLFGLTCSHRRTLSTVDARRTVLKNHSYAFLPYLRQSSKCNYL